jgi:cytochrome c1
MRGKGLAMAVLFVAGIIPGCGAAKRDAAAISGGDPDRGAVSLRRYGCGSCHTIPGISGAHGLVGPSLSKVGERLYIGGSLPNQPANLMHWVQDPHSVNAKTAMPNVGVTARDANDIAAYLYSLR